MPRGKGKAKADFRSARINFKDTGCNLAPSCLRCPFPVCKYDLPGGPQRIATKHRDAEIAKRYVKDQTPVWQLAQLFDVSQRLVQRAICKYGALV